MAESVVVTCEPACRERMYSVPICAEPCYRRLEYEAREAGHSANLWHGCFHELEERHREVKAQLTSALDRERNLLAKCEQLQSHQTGAMSLLEQLGSTRVLVAEKEQKIHEAYKIIASKESELQWHCEELRRKSLDAEQCCSQYHHTKSQLEDMQRRLDTALKTSNAREELVLQLRGQLCAKDAQIDKLRTELKCKDEESQKLRLDVNSMAHQHELRNAEFCSLKQKLNLCAEEAEKHRQKEELLLAERNMWLSRSNHLEQVSARLKTGLRNLANEELDKIPLPPSPCPDFRCRARRV